MIPRFSPPTAIGLPRNRGSAACSTEAKKASASKWTIERGKDIVSSAHLRLRTSATMTPWICSSSCGMRFG